MSARRLPIATVLYSEVCITASLAYLEVLSYIGAGGVASHGQIPTASLQLNDISERETDPSLV